MINERIFHRQVRLIDDKGENLGVVDTQYARERAQEAGLDLVVITETSTPPVCKILDYGKFRYEERKRKSLLRKNQRVVQVKEVKVRPVIDEHDFQVKLKKIINFLADGCRVRVTLRFRGRELSHQEIGMQILERIRTETANYSKVEQQPLMEGRQMIMIIMSTVK